MTTGSSRLGEGLRAGAQPLGPGIRRVHMVGIAGAGMEPLARLLAGVGYEVSGSDTTEGAVVEALRRAGLPVFAGHDESHVAGADLVVYSVAVGEGNCERATALRAGIPQRTRGQILGALSRVCDTVAVAGTHGKTTTASMIAAVARSGGRVPAVAVGGWVGGRTQADIGGGDLLVAEADEYGRSFLELEPWVAVVTNIESEHVDCYADEEELIEAFAAFLDGCQADGAVIVNGDDPACTAAVERAGARDVLRFGFSPACDVRAASLTQRADSSGFDCVAEGRRQRIDLAIPGRHNVFNALGAVAAACRMGIDWESVAGGLNRFAGVDRRFQSKGQVGGVPIVDDYAHHPTEVAAALATARALEHRVHVVFQPHTYSRTRHFRGAFAEALSAATRVRVTAAYAARETPDAGDDGDAIVAELRGAGHPDCAFEPDADGALATALEACREGDLLLVMGAGDIGERLDAFLKGIG